MEDTATGTLRLEHQRILQIASVMERILDAGATDLESLKECVAFFRLFADACHHGQEEGVLFPALESEGMSVDEGPIAVMLYEHGIGRTFIQAMANGLGPLDGGATVPQAVVDAGRGYIDLIRSHIAKEDGILFEMADGMVTGAACTSVCSRYEEVCSGRFEGKTVADLELLAESLHERYPA